LKQTGTGKIMETITILNDTADCQEDDYDIYSDVLRLQGMGLLDKDGMPTDAFFEWCD
jgi:hypothetical protein